MEEIIYQRYTVWKGILKTESDTVEYWDTVNKTRLFKKFQKGQMTIEEIARKNHEDGLLYEVTILEEDTPAVFLQINHKNEFIGVNFMDEVGRAYLTYHFSEIEAKKKLFLNEVWYSYYTPGDKSFDNEEYRINFIFAREGNAAYRKYDEINKKTMDYETKEPLDISGLYEDYPEFGYYDGLIRKERNMKFLEDVCSIKL